jgi:hypothetical protein
MLQLTALVYYRRRQLWAFPLLHSNYNHMFHTIEIHFGFTSSRIVACFIPLLQLVYKNGKTKLMSYIWRLTYYFNIYIYNFFYFVEIWIINYWRYCSPPPLRFLSYKQCENLEYCYFLLTRRIPIWVRAPSYVDIREGKP